MLVVVAVEIPDFVAVAGVPLGGDIASDSDSDSTTLEQRLKNKLMRAIKITGGLIHERALCDNMISCQLFSMPTAVAISTELKEYNFFPISRATKIINQETNI